MKSSAVRAVLLLLLGAAFVSGALFYRGRWPPCETVQSLYRSLKPKPAEDPFLAREGADLLAAHVETDVLETLPVHGPEELTRPPSRARVVPVGPAGLPRRTPRRDSN